MAIDRCVSRRAAYGGDPTLAPIRTHDDEAREASRDDVRLYAIFLDDYHVERFGELRVIDPLLAFVQQLPDRPRRRTSARLGDRRHLPGIARRFSGDP